MRSPIRAYWQETTICYPDIEAEGQTLVIEIGTLVFGATAAWKRREVQS